MHSARHKPLPCAHFVARQVYSWSISCCQTAAAASIKSLQVGICSCRFQDTHHISPHHMEIMNMWVLYEKRKWLANLEKVWFENMLNIALSDWIERQSIHDSAWSEVQICNERTFKSRTKMLCHGFGEKHTSTQILLAQSCKSIPSLLVLCPRSVEKYKTK